MSEFDYIAQVFADYASVREGRKPLLIVSAGKSEFAFESLVRLANEDPEVECRLDGLVCEDGELHDHALFCLAGAPYAREALDEIYLAVGVGSEARTDAERSKARKRLQYRLGSLLGYSARECYDFVHSQLGRTCPCDCCGSPYTVPQDANPGRFVEFAYRY